MHARIVTKQMADVRSRKSLEIVSQGSFQYFRPFRRGERDGLGNDKGTQWHHAEGSPYPEKSIKQIEK